MVKAMPETGSCFVIEADEAGQCKDVAPHIYPLVDIDAAKKRYLCEYCNAAVDFMIAAATD